LHSFRGGDPVGGRGGGQRFDITVKHDIALLGHLPNGLGYYRFSYNGSDRAHVGIIAQEVQQVMPQLGPRRSMLVWAISAGCRSGWAACRG